MAKKVGRATITGERGIALIQRRVLEMGLIWHQRQVDAGIDGDIELRDSVSEVVLNSVIFVQSKASDRPFPGETENGFHYLCDKRDIDYWMSGNAPVLLICSHPDSQEAWWVSVKDAFSDPGARADRKAHFNKNTQRFDAAAREAIMQLGIAPSKGIYLRPPPRSETLISNLLEVRHVSPVIYSAPSPYKSGRDARSALKERDVWSGDWLLRDDMVFSFRPLGDSDLAILCDGPGETFDTDEWADNEDSELRRRVVELLNNTLREMTSRDLRWSRDRRHLFFKATRDLRPRRISTGPRGRGLTVFRAYPNKKDPTKIAFYRHSAVRRQFLRLDGQWFLELLPTYHYTFDGFNESKFTGNLLSQIKRLERNAAVLRQVRMWANYLRREESLLEEVDRRLRFGDLALFDVDRGINDASWKRPKPKDEAPSERLFKTA
ncbi:MAG: DUF4365 domain-containing protein [bacterium]